MKSGLFRKYFSVLSITILVCVFVLSAVLIFFSAQYFRQDRNELMMRGAQTAAQITANDYQKNGYLSRADLESSYETLAGSTGGIVLFCGLDGAVSICSDGSDCEHIGDSVPTREINTIISSGTYQDLTFGTELAFGGAYTMVVGVPVLSSGVTIGYVFVLSSIRSFVSFMTDVFLVIQVVALAMLAIVAFIIYSLLKRMLNPLSDISAVAEAFGKGDFTARVRISGDNEISSLGRVFNKMAEDLQELEISRRSFMGNVAHELRTPMTTIGGYIDGILDGTIPPDQQEKYLQIVSNEVKRLARLTASTLAVARMEETSDSSTLTTVNVCAILMNVVFSAERRINAKSIDVQGLDLPDTYAKCDADMLHQVLYNLVDNAVKFTPERGVITFDVRTSGKRAFISVRNTGPGIAKTDMPQLFDRFYKADKSRGMDKTGSGLGLYIVKTLVGKMGGDVTVSSVEGEYSEFTVELAAATPPKPAKPAEDKQAPKTNIFDRLGKRTKRHDKEE